MFCVYINAILYIYKENIKKYIHKLKFLNIGSNHSVSTKIRENISGESPDWLASY